MFRRLAAAALAASFVVMGAAGVAHADDKGKDKDKGAGGGNKVTLKMATLAPPRSPWGRVFKTWAKAVEQKTDGKVEIQWLWNGTAGPETAVVGKIKSGQIAGSPLTAVGLSDIHKPILALQMPGVFKSWEELDAAREKLRPEFEQAVSQNGLTISGWGDVGIARTMSKGFPVRVPADLRGKSPAMIREDLIAPKVLEVIGGVRGVPDSVMGFLPKLNSGAINIISTPSLAAEQLQWAPRLDHINTNTYAFGMGATALSQKELDKLTADQRDILMNTGKQASAALKGSIRKEDDAAFERLKKKMTVHNPTDAEKAEWKKVFNEACKRLKTSLPGNVLGKIGAC